MYHPYNNTLKVYEWHGCERTVMSGIILTVPIRTRSLLPIKPMIIPGVLQAPKISVRQLSTPLCSAAGEALRHSLDFFPGTIYSPPSPCRTEGKTNTPNAAQSFCGRCCVCSLVKATPERSVHL